MACNGWHDGDASAVKLHALCLSSYLKPQVLPRVCVQACSGLLTTEWVGGRTQVGDVNDHDPASNPNSMSLSLSYSDLLRSMQAYEAGT
jgi:hypothetical protein